MVLRSFCDYFLPDCCCWSISHERDGKQKLEKKRERYIYNRQEREERQEKKQSSRCERRCKRERLATVVVPPRRAAPWWVAVVGGGGWWWCAVTHAVVVTEVRRTRPWQEGRIIMERRDCRCWSVLLLVALTALAAADAFSTDSKYPYTPLHREIFSERRSWGWVAGRRAGEKRGVKLLLKPGPVRPSFTGPASPRQSPKFATYYRIFRLDQLIRERIAAFFPRVFHSRLDALFRHCAPRFPSPFLS